MPAHKNFKLTYPQVGTGLKQDFRDYFVAKVFFYIKNVKCPRISFTVNGS